MLTIEFVETEETMSLGDLFAQLCVDSRLPREDDEILVKNDFAIQVKSLDGFYDIDAFRMTTPESTVVVRLESGETLTASPDHIVLTQNPTAWTKLRDLSSDTVLVTSHGPSKLVSIVDSNLPLSRLYDLQVAIAHSYYVNDIMSHNSHFLTFLGANAMRAKKNVLHFTFELSQEQIGIRYDSNLCDMPSNEVRDNKDNVLSIYKDQKYGHLNVKYFPMHTASVNTLRSYYEKLLITKGWRPDVIIIDYADIMRSSRKYDDPRHELKLLYEELRSWCGEIKTPLWTASQTNRAATESEVIGLESISEAYGKAMTSDVIITLSRKRVEKAAGWGRLYMAKNRAGRDGLLYTIKIDTARSNFIVTAEESPEKLSVDEQQEMKMALKAKWDAVQKAGDLVKKEQKISMANNTTGPVA